MSNEVIDKLDITRQNQKKGGPYSKASREERLKKVFEFHFEKGLATIEIAKILKVNRHTIENDLKIWYSQLKSDFERNRKELLIKYWNRLESQQGRILNNLGYTGVSDSLPFEKLLFQINSSMLEMVMKLNRN